MLRDHQILVGFVIVLIIIPIGVSQVKGIDNYIDIMVFVGIFSLITIGLSLLFGYAGQISLGQAAFFGIGAYTSGIMTAKFNLDPWLAFFVAILITMSVAYLVGIPSLKLIGPYLAMATLAIGIIFYIVFQEWDVMTGGGTGLPNIPGISLFGYPIDTDLKYYALVWSIVILVLIFSINLVHSRFGRALRSIQGSEVAANAMGVNTSKYKIQIFTITAAYASIAGSLYAHYVKYISPGTFSFLFSVKLIIMVVLGGIGNIWGAVLGAFMITYLSNEWLNFLAEYEFLAYGAILLLMTIYLPEGLFGLMEKFYLRKKLVK